MKLNRVFVKRALNGKSKPSELGQNECKERRYQRNKSIIHQHYKWQHTAKGENRWNRLFKRLSRFRRVGFPFRRGFFRHKSGLGGESAPKFLSSGFPVHVTTAPLELEGEQRQDDRFRLLLRIGSTREIESREKPGSGKVSHYCGSRSMTALQ